MTPNPEDTFEISLRSLVPASANHVMATTFFQAGQESARLASLPRRDRTFPRFTLGLIAGVAASLLVMTGFQEFALRSGQLGERSDMPRLDGQGLASAEADGVAPRGMSDEDPSSLYSALRSAGPSETKSMSIASPFDFLQSPLALSQPIAKPREWMRGSLSSSLGLEHQAQLPPLDEATLVDSEPRQAAETWRAFTSRVPHHQLEL